MINEQKMLKMILEDPILKDEYKILPHEYENKYVALESDNAVVSAAAKIIYDLKGKINSIGEVDESDKKKVYKTVFNHLNENLTV